MAKHLGQSSLKKKLAVITDEFIKIVRGGDRIFVRETKEKFISSTISFVSIGNGQ